LIPKKLHVVVFVNHVGDNMTYATQDGYIYVPKSYQKYTYMIKINDINYTEYIPYAKYTKAATVSVGNFKIEIIQDGSLTEAFNNGDIVKIYHSLNGSNVLKFTGYVENIQNKITDDTSSIILKGRHISSELLNILVSGEYTNTEATDILREIVDNYLADYGYTYTNAEISNESISIKWSNVSVWKAFQDLCTLANMDFYIDEDKDIHFFKQASKLCNDDAIVENDNIIELSAIEKDSTDTKNKVFVYGEDDEGLPVLHTETIGTSQIPREDIFINKNINNINTAESIAKGLSETNSDIKSKGKLTTFLLDSLNPGEMIWITVPSQQIHNKYIIRKFTNDLINMQTTIELKDMYTLASELKSIKEIQLSASNIINPHKLEYSYNFTFDDNTDINTLYNAYISDGSLFLSVGSDYGYMESATKTTSNSVSKIQLLVAGNNIDSCSFKVSANNGISWINISKDEYKEISEDDQGNKLIIKVELRKTGDQRPEIKSIALLYS